MKLVFEGSGVHLQPMIRALLPLVLAAGLLACFPQSRAAAADDGIFPGSAAEYQYRTDYGFRKSHKAFAIGTYGAYGYSWDWRSSKEAANSALKSCRNSVAWWTKKYGVPGKCRLLAQGDTLLDKDPWLGPAWQKPALGDDIPLLKGRSFPYRGLPLNGVVLHVHGCNGLGWDKYAEVWGAYFNALGYSFYAPDSFAESRPAELCGEIPPARAKDATMIMKLRIAQTQRTIAGLKQKYPGTPIYVWGHSEGAAVVKLLNVEVAGIVTSGDECDVGGSRTAAPASVPVLFMFGDNDPNIEGFKLPLTDKKMQKCRNFVRNKKTRLVIVKNSKHEYWPWRPEIAKAMSQFIGAKSAGFPESQPPMKLLLTDSQQKTKANYLRAENHRALAVSTGGSAAWGSKWDFVEDARQFALYECAHWDNVNDFAAPQHRCVLMDVDGKNVTAP
ncbi:MAG: hypothetical protein WCB71_03120 [Aestuariivirga sp.]